MAYLFVKGDDHPYLVNIPVSSLRLWARSRHHALTTYRTVRPVNKADWFIVSTGQNFRFAISICEQVVESLRQQQAASRPVFVPNQLCSYVQRITQAVRHLYIQSSPGCGKTELIDFLLKNQRYWKAGPPSPFLFGTLQENYDYVWFEDFDIIKYSGHLSTLLSLMDGKEITVCRNCNEFYKVREMELIRYCCSIYFIVITMTNWRSSVTAILDIQ
jgi:hypothetical protein